MGRKKRGKGTKSVVGWERGQKPTQKKRKKVAVRSTRRVNQTFFLKIKIKINYGVFFIFFI